LGYGRAKTVGNIVRQTAPTLGNERIWVCIVAGTTHATTEPTWTTGRGDKVTDNTVTWQEITGLAAFNGDLANTPNWTNGAKSTQVSQGHVIKDVAGTHIFLMTSTTNNAGTGAEPSWNTAAVGNTTADASVTWTYMGTSFGAWAAPHKTMVRALNTGWMDSGAGVGRQQIFVGHDHAETQSTAAISFPVHGTNNLNNGNSMDIICVNTAGSVPPVSADLSTAGSITTTGSNAMVVGAGNYRWVYGLTFNCGTSGNLTLGFNNDNADRHYENCTFVLPSGTGSSSNMSFSQAGLQKFKNCTFTFSNASHSFDGSRANLEFDGCTLTALLLLDKGFGQLDVDPRDLPRLRFQRVDGRDLPFGQHHAQLDDDLPRL
jgi:hypothetical protein